MHSKSVKTQEKICKVKVHNDIFYTSITKHFPYFLSNFITKKIKLSEVVNLNMIYDDSFTYNSLFNLGRTKSAFIC